MLEMNFHIISSQRPKLFLWICFKERNLRSCLLCNIPTTSLTTAPRRIIFTSAYYLKAQHARMHGNSLIIIITVVAWKRRCEFHNGWHKEKWEERRKERDWRCCITANMTSTAEDKCWCSAQNYKASSDFHFQWEALLVACLRFGFFYYPLAHTASPLSSMRIA